MEIRLNKLICESGLCSRREADKMIEQGRVLVNDRIAEVGTKVYFRDFVKVDGIPLKRREETVYIALNKPPGITCTTDPTERDNVVDFVNYPSRIFNIGRLDKPSEGLLLLTNDGSIVNKILRESNDHEKEYIVTVDKPITAEFAQRMANGVSIMGIMTKKCMFVQETDTRFQITITQGLNRQIRRMCEALGYDVLKLKRTRIMNIRLDKLPSGEWRFLTTEELTTLNGLLVNSVETAAPAKKKAPSKKKTEESESKAPRKTAARNTYSASSTDNKASKSSTRNSKSGAGTRGDRSFKASKSGSNAGTSGGRTGKSYSKPGGRAGKPSGGSRSGSTGGGSRKPTSGRR